MQSLISCFMFLFLIRFVWLKNLHVITYELFVKAIIRVKHPKKLILFIFKVFMWTSMGDLQPGSTNMQILKLVLC